MRYSNITSVITFRQHTVVGYADCTVRDYLKVDYWRDGQYDNRKDFLDKIKKAVNMMANNKYSDVKVEIYLETEEFYEKQKIALIDGKWDTCDTGIVEMYEYIVNRAEANHLEIAKSKATKKLAEIVDSALERSKEVA